MFTCCTYHPQRARCAVYTHAIVFAVSSLLFCRLALSFHSLYFPFIAIVYNLLWNMSLVCYPLHSALALASGMFALVQLVQCAQWYNLQYSVYYCRCQNNTTNALQMDKHNKICTYASNKSKTLTWAMEEEGARKIERERETRKRIFMCNKRVEFNDVCMAWRQSCDCRHRHHHQHRPKTRYR